MILCTENFNFFKFDQTWLALYLHIDLNSNTFKHIHLNKNKSFFEIDW